MPVATTTVVLYLADLGAGVAAQEVTAQLKKTLANRSRRRRIAGAVSKAAATEGIDVRPALLREWLRRDDVQQQLVLGTHESVETAVNRLSWVMEGSEEARTERALRLVELTCQQYLLAQTSQEATAVTAAQTQALVSAEGQKTRREIRDGLDSITTLVGQLDSNAVFDEDLGRLHAWRAAEARTLAETWPGVNQVVQLLVRSQDRRALLESWSIQQPDVLENAPGSVWCWLGQVANDFGWRRVAIDLIHHGITRGVSDPGYWWARAALAVDGDEHGWEQTRRDLLGNAVSPHPLGRAQEALLDENWSEAQAALEAWDAPAGGDRAIRALIRAECARAQGQLDAAIDILEEGARLEPEATGPALHLAELLLSRGYRGHAVSRMLDFTRAQALSVHARDSRRQWGGDSVAAILVAVKASALASDLNRTWRFTQAEPEGDATPAEAADPRLRREAAVLAAMTMRTDVAKSLAADLRDPYIVEVVAGYNALNEEDFAKAERHWMQAWTHADSVFSRLQVARSLAPLGMRLPDLSALEAEQPDMVDEIRAIHEVMAAGTGERLAKLRAHAHEYEQIAVLLAQELSAEGDFLQAAEVLDEAAKRWGLPLLMKMAGERYSKAGEYERAVQACRGARTLAGENWPGELEALGTEFNALEALGREDESIFVVRRMTALAPDNDDARWVLVKCLVRQANAEAAFAALCHRGRPIRPRTREEARTWINLLTHADRSPYYLPRALDELEQWRDDEEVAGVFLTNITIGLGQRDNDPDQAEIGRLHASTEDYAERFPESPVFRRLRISEEDPLGDLTTILRKRRLDPALQDLQAKVSSGQLPLGLAAEVHRLPYAEASLKRAAGFVFSHVPGSTAEDLEELLQLIAAGPVVFDTTAGVSLLALEKGLREQLLGRFATLESTGAAYRDARAAQQSLALRPTMSMYWDREVDAPRLSETSSEDADELARRADQLVRILTTTRRRDWQIRHFTELDMSGAWLNIVDYAVANALPFWSDDVVLRGLARQAGCTAFGTIDLIEALATVGQLDADTAQGAKATLLTEFHALLAFDQELFRQAAQLDGWKAGGTAAALTWPDVWRSPSIVMQFATHAMGQAAERSREHLSAWVEATATGLAKLGEDDAGASHNVGLLLQSCLGQTWMDPSLLPAVIEGARRVTRLHGGIEDPLQALLELIYRVATEQFNESAAAWVLLHWAQHLDGPDKHQATIFAAGMR